MAGGQELAGELVLKQKHKEAWGVKGFQVGV
jgi:hypothetical protein